MTPCNWPRTWPGAATPGPDRGRSAHGPGPERRHSRTAGLAGRTSADAALRFSACPRRGDAGGGNRGDAHDHRRHAQQGRGVPMSDPKGYGDGLDNVSYEPFPDPVNDYDGKPPLVLIHVDGGIAEEWYVVEGIGKPEVHILDFDREGEDHDERAEWVEIAPRDARRVREAGHRRHRSPGGRPEPRTLTLTPALPRAQGWSECQTGAPPHWEHTHEARRLQASQPARAGALVRQWKRFADATMRVRRSRRWARLFSISPGQRYSLDLELEAKARAGYLFSPGAWFRITFEAPSSGGDGVTDPILLGELFEQGQSLDDILWELHPQSLFARWKRRPSGEGHLSRQVKPSRATTATASPSSRAERRVWRPRPDRRPNRRADRGRRGQRAHPARPRGHPRGRAGCSQAYHPDQRRRPLPARSGRDAASPPPRSG